MSAKTRFQDPLQTIASFGDHFLVVCPSCGGCAHVRGHYTDLANIRFVCPACGRNERWQQGDSSIVYYAWGRKAPPAGCICIGGSIDWYFHYPVWLAIPCCGETLWAYNEEHLGYLQSYVSATLRERSTGLETQSPRVRNSSLASRLPRWLSAARNRQKVLAAIAKLRERLPK